MNQQLERKFKDYYNYEQSENMSWYNAYSDSTRSLQSLIDNKPTLETLLEFPDFLQILKAYQPKLLQYISSSNEIPKDIIRLITIPPQETDSDARKYKLPLLATMAIETNTTCIINLFFKINPQTQRPYFISAFDQFLFTDEELLPLLCGYFSQMNVTLWNNRYKETIDLVYDFKSPLLLLAKHTYNKAIINTMLLYLNLDLTRNPTLIPQRTQLKLQIIKIFYEQIKTAFEASRKDSNKNPKNEIIVENICDILIEVVEKYYLITDGKNMLDVITTQENVDLVMNILVSKTGISLSVVGLVIVLMRYYCLSSFNQEDITNPELSKKNQERLEAQPFIKKITELVPVISQQLFKTNKFTLYHSRILQIFIPIIQLSSKKLSEAVKKNRFLENIISLLFRWPLLSIVHKQVERAYIAIFSSERRICQEYRKHLFCFSNLIELTAGECLAKVNKYSDSTIKPGWFSYIMKIVKVYSKIQTNDEEVNASIMQRAQLWEKFSAFLMRPYDAISFKDLGSYEGLPDKAPLEFSVKSLEQNLANIAYPASKKIIQQLIQEQSMQEFRTNMPEKTEEIKTTNSTEDALFNIQDFQRAPQLSHTKSNQSQNVPPQSPTVEKASEKQAQNNNNIQVFLSPPSKQLSKQQTSPVKPTSPKDQHSKNFNDYLSSKKQQIGQEIAHMRRSSSEKRLSANKSRVTSPSPKKERKKWDDNTNDPSTNQPNKPAASTAKQPIPEQRKQKISLASQFAKPPSLPQHPKSPRPNIAALEQKKGNNDLVVSSLTSLSDDKIQKSISFEDTNNLLTVSLHESNSEDELQLMMKSKSAIISRDLKNVQFRKQKANKPSKSQFRKIGEQDKAFLLFLGVNI